MSDRPSSPATTPRWVKVTGLVVAVLALLVVVMLLLPGHAPPGGGHR